MATITDKVQERARALRRSATVLFEDAVEDDEESTLFGATAETVRSDGAKEEISWLSDFAEVTRFDGEREFNDFKEFGFSVEPKHFEITLKVDADDLADQKMAMYTRRIQQRVAAFRRHRREMVARRLANGFDASNTSYDDVSYFSTSHPIYTREGDEDDAWVETSTQSNVAESGGTTNFPLKGNYSTAEGLSDVISQMETLRASNGVRIQDNAPDTLVVPSNLRKEARELTADQILDSSANALRPNPVADDIEQTIIEPALDDYNPDFWALVNSESDVLMPMIYLLRQPVRTQSQAEGSESHFMENNFYYGADARYEVTYGHYQAIVASDGSGSAL
jgi:phage major head subunit gpT-like protein